MVDELFVEWVREHRELLENLRSEGVLTPYTIKNIDEALGEL
jgi:hypothetical protein